jgi:hypothetical protein
LGAFGVGVRELWVLGLSVLDRSLSVSAQLVAGDEEMGWSVLKLFVLEILFELFVSEECVRWWLVP